MVTKIQQRPFRITKKNHGLLDAQDSFLFYTKKLLFLVILALVSPPLDDNGWCGLHHPHRE